MEITRSIEAKHVTYIDWAFQLPVGLFRVQGLGLWVVTHIELFSYGCWAM